MQTQWAEIAHDVNLKFDDNSWTHLIVANLICYFVYVSHIYFKCTQQIGLYTAPTLVIWLLSLVFCVALACCQIVDADGEKGWLVHRLHKHIHMCMYIGIKIKIQMAHVMQFVPYDLITTSALVRFFAVHFLFHYYSLVFWSLCFESNTVAKVFLSRCTVPTVFGMK